MEQLPLGYQAIAQSSHYHQQDLSLEPPSTGTQQEDSDNDSTPSKPGKRSGKRKIKIEYIEEKSKRHITFSKRKAGIMKKAYELSTLTGTQVLLLVVSETGLVYTFTTPKLQPIVANPEGKSIIQACLNASEPISPQDTAPHLSPNNNAVPIIGTNATSTIKSESYDTTTPMSKYESTSLYSPQHDHHSPHSLHSPHPIPQSYPARQHVGQIDTQQRLQHAPSHRPHPIQPHNQIYQHHIQQVAVQYQLPNASQPDMYQSRYYQDDYTTNTTTTTPPTPYPSYSTTHPFGSNPYQ